MMTGKERKRAFAIEFFDAQATAYCKRCKKGCKKPSDEIKG